MNIKSVRLTRQFPVPSALLLSVLPPVFRHLLQTIAPPPPSPSLFPPSPLLLRCLPAFQEGGKEERWERGGGKRGDAPREGERRKEKREEEEEEGSFKHLKLTEEGGGEFY